MIDITTARTFMATHARLLDRRRLDLLLDGGSPDPLLTALAAHRNPDGGFGWALEPDMRSPTSQPVGAYHAFELLEAAAPRTSPMAVELCDWLASVATPDGGIPFSLAGAADPGSSPVWAHADTTAPSLHITSAIAANAHRVAAHDPAVAAHPWLEQATAWCWEAIAALDGPRGAYELRFVLQLLDAVADARADARAQIERLVRHLPDDWEAPVAGGLADEKLHPLEFSPRPHGAVRELAPADAIARDLARLERAQRDDGGWTIDFAAGSPAAALEWRGHFTALTLATLHAHGRLTDD
jgi:hypothetical protein